MKPVTRLALAALAASSLTGRPAAAAEAATAPPAPSANAADESRELELIPPATAVAPAVTPAPNRMAMPQQRYLEDAFSAFSYRGSVAPPPSSLPHWQERLLLDLRYEWRLNAGLHLRYSGRLNLRAEDDLPFPNHENVINDLRELYLDGELAQGTFWEAGRVNLKSGVALGYNPTDFFKTRAVVEPLSLDPSVLREDRLGTLMLRVEHVGARGSVALAYAPRVRDPTPIYANDALPSFDPMLDRTNAANRLLLKVGVNVAPNFSPEMLFYRDGASTRWGANLTVDAGQRTVAYLEWNGGSRGSLVDQAVGFGREAGTLPPNVPFALPHSERQAFQNELALGTSYTTGNALNVTLEYQWNQAGLGTVDWRNWFALARSPGAASPVSAQLWFVRAYAGDQQQPVSRHMLFVRLDQPDAFIRKLELSGFLEDDLLDGSAVLQFGASYFLSDHWTVAALMSGYLGGTRSDFGSTPERAGFLVEVTRYL